MTLASLEPRIRASHIWPRNHNDWYVEPGWTSARLFDAEPFVGAIHDPAAGMGRTSRQHAHTVLKQAARTSSTAALALPCRTSPRQPRQPTTS